MAKVKGGRVRGPKTEDQMQIEQHKQVYYQRLVLPCDMSQAKASKSLLIYVTDKSLRVLDFDEDFLGGHRLH